MGSRPMMARNKPNTTNAKTIAIEERTMGGVVMVKASP